MKNANISTYVTYVHTKFYDALLLIFNLIQIICLVGKYAWLSRLSVQNGILIVLNVWDLTYLSSYAVVVLENGKAPWLLIR